MLQPLSRRNRPARLGRVRAAQGRQHRGRGLAGRVAAAADPPALAVRPCGQVQPHVPAAVAPARRPRAPLA